MNATSHALAFTASNNLPAASRVTNSTSTSSSRPSSRARSTAMPRISAPATSRCAKAGLPMLMPARRIPFGARSRKTFAGMLFVIRRLWTHSSQIDSLEQNRHRRLSCRLAGNRWARQLRFAGLDDEVVFERKPRPFDVGCRGRLIVMAYVLADQRARDAELHIGLEVRIIARIDLRELRLEARLVDQEMNVRRPQVMPSLRAQQVAHRSIHGNRVPGRFHATEA